MALSERRRKEIASLTRRKYRDVHGQMLVEGVRSLRSAVEANATLVEVLVSAGVREEASVAALLDRVAVPVHVLAARDMARLSEVGSGQGLLAVARTTLCPESTLQTLDRVLVLDGVQDPGNTGTLLRTAAWFGIDGVLAGPGTVDFFNPKTVRAAMGGLWDVCLTRTNDLAAELQRLRKAGFALYGADLEGTGVDAWQVRTPSALILGSEAHGLSAAVRAALDARITIAGAPTRRGAESLNVAVAAGILMHYWLEAIG